MRNPMPSRALRVLFDESLAVNPAGTGTFARGLRRALDGIDGVEVVGSRIGGESMRSIEVARKPLRRRLGSAAAHLRYYGLVLPARARKIHADVVFSPSTLGPLRGPTPWVVTVHDLAPLEQAATMHWLSRIYLRRTLELQLRRATAVCTVSAAVRAELGERFPELDGDRVHVVPDAPDLELLAAEPRPLEGLDRPFLLMVGTIEPRKNQVTALRALARYLEREPGSPLVLVMAGSPGWLVEPIVKEIDRLGLGSRVRRTGRVDPARLSWLYRHARALLFPSLYEGFGIPVIEAFALGCPVIAARIPPVCEVAGADGATLLDPLEVEPWAEAIAAAAAAPPDPARVEAARARAASFSWEASAGALHRALLSAVQR